QKVVEKVKMIESDRTHGASWLAREAVKTLVQASEAYESDNVEDYLTRLKILAERLMNLRPSMASFNNQVGELLYRVVEKSKSTSRLDEIKRFVESEAESLSRASEEAAKAIAENVLKLIPEKATIFTHSYSSTVIEALKLAHDHKRDLQIFVTESRPLFEGRATAKELAEYGVPTTLVTDAAAGYFAGTVNLVLLGADSLLADGSIINKAGTYSIVLAAAYQGVPVYVAAELSKVNLRSYFTRILLEEKDWSEVWPDGPDTVSIRNLYFDITPKFFIAGVITESRRIRPDEILRICQDMIKNRYIV
ncbi:MAG: translation initiation factor eIF-2B, partial [Nitrososphaerales archaeon]